jgi:hypothetical protein
MSRKITRDWLPPIVSRLLQRTFAEFKFLGYPRKDLLQKNKVLERVGKGRRAFLLATGPSIKQENLKLLAGEDCFTISNAFLHDDIQVINPIFQAFAPYHPPLILEKYVEWLRQADNTLPPRTRIVLGHSTYDIVEEYGLFPEREVHYIYLGAGRRHIDLTRPVLGPQTGIILLLPLVIYMGYERIYLLGCDSTALRDYGKTLQNFYRSDRDVRANSNIHWSDLETEMRGTLAAFDQFKYYRDILAGTSTSIVNLSVDSWLEMFPFDRLEQVV